MFGRFPTLTNVYEGVVLDAVALGFLGLAAVLGLSGPTLLRDVTWILLATFGVTILGILTRHLYTAGPIYPVLLVETTLAALFGILSF